MKKKNQDTFTLSAIALEELKEIQEKDKNSSLPEILEKAIDLLNAVEMIGDTSVPALNTEYVYRVKKDIYHPVYIEE